MFRHAQDGYTISMLQRVLRPLSRRWPWLRTALRVQERFDEVHGGYLASAITFAAFTSLFPLLLVGVSLVGALAFRDVDVTGRVVETLGLSGQAAETIDATVRTAEQSRRIAGPIGLAGLLWSGLGLVSALQYALDDVWQASGRGLRDRLIGLLWLAGAMAILLGSFAVTAAVNLLPGSALLALPVGLALDLVLWLWTLRTLTAVRLPWKAILPGAALGAIGLELLKLIGAVYVPRAVAQASGLYGSLGVVFAVLAWLFFFARLVVYASVLNVIRWEEDHGTVTAEIQLPRHPDRVAVEATRAGEASPDAARVPSA